MVVHAHQITASPDAAGFAENDVMAVSRAYVTRAVADPDRRESILKQLAQECPPDRAAALRRIHALLADQPTSQCDVEAAAASVNARIRARYPGLTPTASRSYYRGASMPPMARQCMRPPDVDQRPWHCLAQLLTLSGRRARAATARHMTSLTGVLRYRRALLMLLIWLPAFGATAYFASVLPHRGSTMLELAIVFAGLCLFAWILTGFWTAIAGYFVLRYGERHHIRESAEEQPRTGQRTAVVMPIHEEDIARTFAGMQAVFESLDRTGRLDEFDFFILSDSVRPDTIAAEQRAWAETCRAINGFGRLFYRRRRARVKRKSGNIADFCRRWSGAYEYMIVLDADSIMTGATITTLVDRMQANPGVGVLQTPPMAVNRDSFLARVQQFATHVYGRMFAAGLHYWRLDKGYYWGHNAIIRLAPFTAHCALPRLPGRGALAGDILSHDFVEAALMSRAGWGVFIAWDLGGSYEEVPPSLLEELGRDRRWCRGNLQHLRLLFTDHLAPAHRALFANGAMAYTSAAIWFVFLLLSTAEAVLEAIRVPDYFPRAGELFPDWPVWDPIWAVSLLLATAVVLFLPKILGLLLVIRRGLQAQYGGGMRLVASTLIEIVLTMLLAPIRMLIHTWFVTSTLVGRPVSWNGQQRTDQRVPWGRALRFHLPGQCLAVAWGALLLRFSPGFLPWLAPVLLPLLLAPAITVLTSRIDAGRWMRRHRLQLIPEEARMPVELVRTRQITDSSRGNAGFATAVVNPAVNALHTGLQGRHRQLSERIRSRREQLVELALRDGPAGLNEQQQCHLLADPWHMTCLHARVWKRQPQAWRPWLGAWRHE